MSEQAGTFWDRIKARIAAHFGMVYIHVDMVIGSMEQERYLTWLLEAMESEEHTKDELRDRVKRQKEITEYLRAGRTYIK
jgi:hypothetical protein